MEPLHVETLIIGAGIAGLSCAKRLADSGSDVLVVDKARGSGGRLSSKTITLDDGQQVVFDLGCAGISAKTPIFQDQIKRWQDDGLIESWRKAGDVVEYVGKPRNSMITRYLADQLKTHFSLRIEKLEQQEGRWRAFAKVADLLMPVVVADRVVVATPAEQAASLLPSGHGFFDRIAGVNTLPQWVVAMVTPKQEAAVINQIILSDSLVLWSVVCDSQKPGRQTLQDKCVWQIQLRTDWSAQHCDLTPDDVGKRVFDELYRLTGYHLGVSDYYVHRWLYAAGHRQIVDDADCLWDQERGIGICGDYFNCHESVLLEPRRFGVESALLSGWALATRMVS